jgi:hypothetical protein
MIKAKGKSIKVSTFFFLSPYFNFEKKLNFHRALGNDCSILLFALLKERDDYF